jgi:hypothetical protein
MRPWLYEAGLLCGIAFVASQCHQGGWLRRHVFLLFYLSVIGFGSTIYCLNLPLCFGFPLYYLFSYFLVT